MCDFAWPVEENELGRFSHYYDSNLPTFCLDVEQAIWMEHQTRIEFPRKGFFQPSLQTITPPKVPYHYYGKLYNETSYLAAYSANAPTEV